MENSLTLTQSEATTFEEYKRKKRILEIKSKLKNMEPTLLRKNVSISEIRAFCARVKTFSPVCVLVQPTYVKSCRILLRDSGIGVSCNIGGNCESLPAVKIYECKRALLEGATELDYSPCTSYIVNGNFALLKKEIRRVMRASHGRRVKIELDGDGYSEEQLLRSAQMAIEAGAKYLSIPADDRLLILLQENLKSGVKIKVRGVKTAQAFCDVFALNCARIGCENIESVIDGMQDLLNEPDTPVTVN